jgi:1,4-alpha-glucan branching enzyme
MLEEASDDRDSQPAQAQGEAAFRCANSRHWLECPSNTHKDKTIMKKKSIHRNGHSTCPVRFDFTHAEASEVSIAGIFNEWKPQVTPMLALGTGRWFKILALPPGKYEYRFVADDNWMSDPQAPKTVPNPVGSVNSLLEVRRRTKTNGVERP